MKRRVMLLVEIVLAALVVGCGPSSCGVIGWSPDGRKIVTVWPSSGGNSILMVVDLQTGRSSALPGVRQASCPLWSPDGRSIAYVRESGDGAGVFVHDTIANRSRRIGSSPAVPVVWREDSARLLTVADGAAVCHSMPDGVPTWEARLPDKAQATIAQGAWIADTDVVAFLAGSDVWLIEGAETANLTTTGDVIGFAVMPGGREIVWARASRNPRYILLTVYATSLKERQARRLEFPERVVGVNPNPRVGPDAVGRVAFAPDGRRMAVTCLYDRGKRSFMRVFTMTVDGREARQAWPPANASQAGKAELVGEPAFAPDGSRLAIVATIGKQVQLYVCDADGTHGKTMLTAPLPE